jgi:tetratricopeptide (TPR) repeat protein
MMPLRDCGGKYNWGIIAGLIVLTCSVYVQVAWHDFINYDDPFIVTMNKNISDGLTLEGIRWAFTTPCEGNWIPLSWISHMLDIQLFGLNPAGHHSVNVLLHVASTVLLFQFFTMTTGEKWKSALVALFFALHPLHVESVAWVAERKDVLSAFFWMLTLCLYARYVRVPGVYRYTLCLVSFLLGLLAKPMLVTLPLILLLLDVWPLGRLEQAESTAARARLLRLLAEKIPFVLLTVVVSIITYLTQKAGGTISENYTLMSRTGKAVTYYVAYLAKTVWPTELSVFYPRSLYPSSAIEISGALLLLVVMTLISLLLYRCHPYLLIGWLWYVITLLPVIGLVQIGMHSIADRYTYIPLIGVFVAVVWGIQGLTGNWHMKEQVLCALAGALVVSMMVLTSFQLGHWKNSITLFSHAIEVTDGNYLAYNNLGNALLEAGRVREATQYLQLAIKERPADTFAWLNLGNAYRQINEHENALDAYLRVLQFEPRSEKGHYELGVEYLVIGRQNLANEEYTFLRQAGSNLAPKLLAKIIRSQ